MNRRWLFLMLVFILILSVTACQRSASPLTMITPTLDSDLPFPVNTQPPLMLDIINSTQTAIAAETVDGEENGIELEEVEATATSEPEPTATQTPVVFPTSTPGRPATYTLERYEFPYCIARRFNVNPTDLLSLNGLTANSRVDPGLELKIPTTGSWDQGPRALKEHPAQYTVRAGDTVYKIACEFGDVSPNEIIDANSLESGGTLSVGQVLLIP